MTWKHCTGDSKSGHWAANWPGSQNCSVPLSPSSGILELRHGLGLCKNIEGGHDCECAAGEELD